MRPASLPAVRRVPLPAIRTELSPEAHPLPLVGESCFQRKPLTRCHVLAVGRVQRLVRIELAACTWSCGGATTLGAAPTWTSTSSISAWRGRWQRARGRTSPCCSTICRPPDAERPSRDADRPAGRAASDWIRYSAVMLLLVAIWALTGAGHPWPLYPALGWGIPLLLGATSCRNKSGHTPASRRSAAGGTPAI